jgi:catechol 2,3-dioxygenase-like lactoylglutathione lyase family enzyme
MAFVRLHHVQVAAPPDAEDEARGFYAALLGMEEVEKPMPLAQRGGVWFACGDQTLHVGVTPDFVAAQKAHPAFEIDSPEALRAVAARLVEAGVEVRWSEELPAYERFYANDPWGNRLELLAAAR